MQETSKLQAGVSANVSALGAQGEGRKAKGTYSVKFYEYEGGPVFREDTIENVITNVGINLGLDTMLAGSSYTTTGPYMGLISSASWTNLATTISSLTSYATNLVTLATAGSHGLLPGDTFTIASATGTGTNYALVNGTWIAAAGTTGTTLVFSIGVAGVTITTLTGGNVTTTSGTRIGDTMASHGNWLEAGNAHAPTFSARLTPSFSSASAGSKTTSAAVSFTMTGTGTVEGCFLVYGSGAVATIDNTSGTLFSAGAFSGGAQAVVSGNVIAVTYTVSF